MKTNRPIIIIDDDPVSIFLTREILNSLEIEMEVLAFEDANRALHFLNQKGDNYTILLDLNMPLMSGWEFVNSCVEQKLSPEVYTLSSSVNPRDIERIDQYDFVRSFLSKPLNPEMLEIEQS